MWFILILVSLFLVLREKESKILALIIFLLAGFLGIASLNLNLKEPLLPLLTGLFGASNIIFSIRKKTKLPPQKIIPIKKIKLSKKSFLKSTLASIIAAPFTAFLPGLGASQAAVIGNEITLLKQKEFLFLLGAINTIVMGLSFIALYSIGRTRTGAAVAISKLLPELTLTNLVTIISFTIIAGVLASLLTIRMAKLASKKINEISYSTLSILVLLAILLIVILFSDFTMQGRIISLLIFTTSTSLGIFTISSGVKRMHLMGCLLLPTILFYLL
jgi:putative membrane protein